MTKLTVDVAREVGADVIVKGLRDGSDFESEMQQAQMNKAISGIADRVPALRPRDRLHRRHPDPPDRPVRRRRPARLDGPRRRSPNASPNGSPSDGVREQHRRRRHRRRDPGPARRSRSSATRKSVPLSTSVMVDKDEVLELLEDALDRLPDELRQARWMLKEREEFLAKVAARGRRDPRSRPGSVPSGWCSAPRSCVRPGTRPSGSWTTPSDEARRLRLEAEDYCDQKLAAFEIVLERTLKTVAAGREKLSVTPAPADRPEAGWRPTTATRADGVLRPGPVVGPSRADVRP